jgi:hypothetical protein
VTEHVATQREEAELVRLRGKFGHAGGAASPRKGEDGELELVALYLARGYNAVRVRRKGDIAGVPGVHIEAKRCERLRIWEALEQTLRDADLLDIAALHFRRSDGPWFVAIPLDDFLTLLELRERA